VSRGCADAGAAERQTNTATAQAKQKTGVVSMMGLPVCAFSVQRHLSYFRKARETQE
jgi:hypothetical protein